MKMTKNELRTQRIKTRELLMRLLYQMGVTEDYSNTAIKRFLEEYVATLPPESDDESSKESDEGRIKITLTYEDDESNGIIIEPDNEYFNEMLQSFIDNKDSIDATIEAASNNWKFKRIAKVDLAILRLSITEMLYYDNGDFPEKVSINEAVELAKKYGSEKSPSFINGLLGRIAREEAANGTKTD